MKTCAKCGEVNQDNALHCGKCGNKLSLPVRSHAQVLRTRIPLNMLPPDTFIMRCPDCGKFTRSLKRYRLVQFLLFIGIAGGVRHETYTACPSCMRKILLKQIFSWNILTGNILWLLVFLPYHLALMIATTKKGHSKNIPYLIV